MKRQTIVEVFPLELIELGYRITLRSSSDHVCLNGMIFSVKICH